MPKPLNHPLPMSQKKDYEMDGKPVNVDRLFRYNDLSYEERSRILQMDVGETIEIRDRTLNRVK